MFKAKWELPQWVAISAMFVLAAITWPVAPEQIPIHWNIEGEVDSHAGRFGGLLALPLMALGLYFFLLAVPLLDRERLRHPGFAGPFALIRTGTIMLLAVIYLATHLLIRGVRADMSMVVGVGVGVLFGILGIALHRMPTDGPPALNTPWVIKTPQARRRVQTIAGRVFGLTGLAVAVAALIDPVLLFGTIIGGSVAASALILVYSYRVSRE